MPPRFCTRLISQRQGARPSRWPHLWRSIEGAALVIMPVEELPMAYGGGEFYGIEVPDREELQRMLTEVVPSDPAVTCEQRLLVGAPARAIVEMAEKEKVEMIVVASHVAGIFSACGECDYCLNERGDLCPNFQATGRDRNDGYAAFMTAPAAFLLQIPGAFTDAQAASLLCAGGD